MLRNNGGEGDKGIGRIEMDSGRKPGRRNEGIGRMDQGTRE